jgi:hypothetical protein
LLIALIEADREFRFNDRLDDVSAGSLEDE